MDSIYIPLNIAIFYVYFYNFCIILGITYFFFKYIICNIIFTNSDVNTFPFNIITSIWSLLGISFPDKGFLIYAIIMIFFIIMYIIYLIIIIIIPETGFPTLFIPIREILLKIPPLEQINNRGVFRMFTNFINMIIGNDMFIIKFKNFFDSYFTDVKYSFYEMINLYNPEFNTIIENMEIANNNNTISKKNKINNDIDVCINSNATFTPPDTNFFTMLLNNFKDTKTNINCNLNKTGVYISTEE